MQGTHKKRPHPAVECGLMLLPLRLFCALLFDDGLRKL